MNERMQEQGKYLPPPYTELGHTRENANEEESDGFDNKTFTMTYCYT